MARGKRTSEKNSGKQSNGANLGFEAKLWAAADKLRNNMDAAEYKHVVLGLIFLKYISDAFEERHHSSIMIFPIQQASGTSRSRRHGTRS